MKIDIDQLDFLDPLLKLVLMEIESLGFEFTITRLYRPGDSGGHGTITLRAADLGICDKLIGDLIADLINAKYHYDPERPTMRCVICHDSGMGLRLHVQVHPNTEYVPRP